MGGGAGGGCLAFPVEHSVAGGGTAEEGEGDGLVEDFGAEVEGGFEAGLLFCWVILEGECKKKVFD